MSTKKKYKTSFKRKTKSTTDYWGDEAEPQYTEEQKKRIASYLKENDENCKESTTLILIIVIGLLVALSIVGFLAIRNNSSVKYKGAHTTSEHAFTNTSILDVVWSKWNWLQGLYFGLNLNTTNSTLDSTEIQAIVALEEELNDFQPIYRNPLLQRLYSSSDQECNDLSDDSLYNFISIKHGSWIPSKQYLEEAVDFSWADFEDDKEKEEIELVQNLDLEDITDKDRRKKEKLKKQIETDRRKREKQNKKEQKQKEKKEKKEKKEGKKKTNKKEKEENEEATTRRLLLPKNAKFDPFHAMPNPANILNPKNVGDRGPGDVRKNNMPDGKGMPGWMQKRGPFPGPMGHQHFHDMLPFGNRQHLKHLDAVRNRNRDRMKSPKDVLSNLDLSRFGINHPVNDETSDKEKRLDLAQLEQQESKRHPFMSLLTNPGQMEDIQCINKEHRKHEVIFTHDATQMTNKNDVSVFTYDSNVLMWYCYLIQIESDALNDLSQYAGAFKVNLTFYDVDMEIGFDYIDIYINSMLTESISGIGLNWEPNEQRPQFVYYMDSDYTQRNGNALEICMKIVTDSSIIRQGFKSVLSVDYDDPQITTWSEWSPCTTKKASHYKDTKDANNDAHWNGDCGVGIRSKSVTECKDPMVEITDRAPCNVGESMTQYCIKENCFDFAMNVDPQHPNRAFLFNGHGRVDPDFADPFTVQRSSQESFNITNIMQELSMVRDEIIARYPDERALSTAVINHYFMDESKFRLGIRLARSLLLGDSFTVYMTGSSDTAGHENMFMSTWPMQFQSIMRPVWRRVGYKGAAFVVKNHAQAADLGTMQSASCIPSLVGDDADVVWWESTMDDHGDAIHAVENHFRNAITLPRRPLYHVMHAGKNGRDHPDQWAEQYKNTKGGKPGQFKNEPKCFQWLCGTNTPHGNPRAFKDGLLNTLYTHYGAGITMFYPTEGLAAVNKTKYEEFKPEYLYVSRHAGPRGHRVYAEMLAYYYLTCALETFADIKDLIDDLTPSNEYTDKPIEEMLEILEDPPTTKQIPHDHVAGQCDPVCTNATEAVCIAGYETLGKPRFSLKRWRYKDNHDEDIGQWQYDSWMKNPESFLLKEGGQASCDIKNEWSTSSKDSNELKFSFEAKQYGYVAIEADHMIEDVKANKLEILVNEIDMETGKVSSNPKYKQHGKPLQCMQYKAAPNWMMSNYGCNIAGLQPYQKYELVVNILINGNYAVKNIRIF